MTKYIKKKKEKTYIHPKYTPPVGVAKDASPCSDIVRVPLTDLGHAMHQAQGELFSLQANLQI